jgi:hypothetical protein
MTSRYKSPGVSRENRISEQGLLRLEKQLSSTVKISQMVLDQWVLRYGEPAQQLIDKYRKSKDKTDK